MRGHWISTLCFRQFRDKHTALSRLYWTYILGIDAIRQLLDSAPATAFAAEVVQASFKRGMLPETVHELVEHHLEERCGIERVHLLAVCSANLEAYLQEAAKLYVAGLGHVKGIGKLTAVGDALARPVLNSSTVPNMISYIQELLRLDLGHELGLWRNAYKLRCAAVHNGGFVTPRVLKEVPDIGLAIGARITVAWGTLKDFLNGADQVALKVDRVIASHEVRAIEVEWLLHDLRSVEGLPPPTKVWQMLSQRWGIEQIPNVYKRRIIQSVYKAVANGPSRPHGTKSAEPGSRATRKL
jgi:hypothetical protein